MDSIFHDHIRKIPISAKRFLCTLKAYTIMYIIIKFRHSSFSQSEVNIGGGDSFSSSTPKNKVQKHSQIRPKCFVSKTCW